MDFNVSAESVEAASIATQDAGLTVSATGNVTFPGINVTSTALMSGASSSLCTIMFMVSVGIAAEAVTAARSCAVSSLPCKFLSHALRYSGLSTPKLFCTPCSSGENLRTVVPPPPATCAFNAFRR